MFATRPIYKLALRRAPLTLHHGAKNVVRSLPAAIQLAPIASVRHYSQKPPGGPGGPGGQGGFPGFNMFGQQQEKGDALKQYVRCMFLNVHNVVLNLGCN